MPELGEIEGFGQLPPVRQRARVHSPHHCAQFFFVHRVEIMLVLGLADANRICGVPHRPPYDRVKLVRTTHVRWPSFHQEMITLVGVGEPTVFHREQFSRHQGVEQGRAG